MFCSQCGEESKKEENLFCESCGAPLKDDSIPSNRQPSQPITNEGYKKIGGWLYVVAFGLFLSPFLFAYGVIESLITLTEDSTAAMFALVPGLEVLIWIEIIIEAGLFFVAVYLCFIFVQKRRDFKKEYVLFLFAYALYAVIDIALFSTLDTHSTEMQVILDEIIEEGVYDTAKIIISSGIWITYMRLSERVKDTFVN